MKAYHLIPGLFLLAGCPQVKKVDGMNGGGGAVPAAVQARFTTYCATKVGCHVQMGGLAPDLSAGAPAEALDGSAGNGIPYLTPGDINNSWVAQKLLPGTPGPMPPPNEPQPTPEDRAIIIGWIAGAPFPEGESDTDTATGTDTMTVTETMGSESTGPGEPMLCALDVIDPAADVAAAVDAGDAAGQIPTVIGDILVANCGCHYTANVPMEYGAAYAGNQPMATLDDFTGAWMGILPNLPGPAHAAILMRVDGLAMPPAACDPDGTPAAGNAAMTEEEHTTLVDWLTAGAPDGASFP